ncbi:MAG TPA: hypothetical protein VMM18_17430 [Gemmatimonadaceae bacterium]|nr:hypothetical protein [Gemmatimonadaceae bacterium]
MGRFTSTLVIAALLSLTTTDALHAQAEQGSRSGFGLSLGLGMGSAGVTCEGCEEFEEDRMNGISGYLRIGGYASPRFFAGVEGTGWMHNSDGLERRIAALSVVFVGYPSETTGFFVRSGFGGIRAVIEDTNNNVAVGTGLTWQIGVGYDIPFGAVALTPYVTFVNSMEVGLNINEVSTGFNLNPNILQYGLAITLP